ncbi:uncharacterized protein VNE69_08166 [Vairimorpha necatrix]|uniref:Uncharacterized protein n=1 Tax=Vairimorpha necatrix TaxID=6039 RepID=A0AAX4JEU6_9MICR
MFQYVLLVLSGTLENNSNNILWRGWEMQSRNFGLNQDELMIQATVQKKSSFSYNACVSRELLEKIEVFVDLMKQIYLNTESYTALKNIFNFEERAKIFHDAFQNWKKEKFLCPADVGTYKFPEKNKEFIKQIETKMCYCKYKKWVNNFNKVLNINLPKINEEIIKSSIEEGSKRLITNNIKYLHEVMSYYRRLQPENLSYEYNTNTLKLYYRLMVSRFPYLFDYFNLCERFITLYELIFENFIKKVDDHYKMICELYLMSMNLIYVLKNRENFLIDIRTNLALIETLEQHH